MENAESIVKEVKEVQGTVESILRDTLGDYKEREKAREKRDFRKDVTIWALIIALVISFFYYQWSFRKFLNQYDFASEIMVEGNEYPAFYQKGERNTLTLPRMQHPY